MLFPSPSSSIPLLIDTMSSFIGIRKRKAKSLPEESIDHVSKRSRNFNLTIDDGEVSCPLLPPDQVIGESKSGVDVKIVPASDTGDPIEADSDIDIEYENLTNQIRKINITDRVSKMLLEKPPNYYVNRARTQVTKTGQWISPSNTSDDDLPMRDLGSPGLSKHQQVELWLDDIPDVMFPMSPAPPLQPP